MNEGKPINSVVASGSHPFPTRQKLLNSCSVRLKIALVCPWNPFRAFLLSPGRFSRPPGPSLIAVTIPRTSLPTTPTLSTTTPGFIAGGDQGAPLQGTLLQPPWLQHKLNWLLCQPLGKVCLLLLAEMDPLSESISPLRAEADPYYGPAWPSGFPVDRLCPQCL
jgi:hypothetical protein